MSIDPLIKYIRTPPYPETACYEPLRTCVIITYPNYECWGGGNGKFDINYFVCNLKVQKNCVEQCSNGEVYFFFVLSLLTILIYIVLQYSTNFTNVDPYNYLHITPATCIPCSPGTWNTCTRKELCTWTLPEEPPEMLNLGPDIYPMLDGPVGSCYPCSQASNTVHYLYPEIKKFSSVTGLKEWSCPG